MHTCAFFNKMIKRRVRMVILCIINILPYDKHMMTYETKSTST